ncbi:MAG: hypothetical protein JNN07_18350 [Verrucomicrobiales bacterium]|nr:hypothetical protein [Verrucomicrobiales bacterium]
MRVLAQNRRLKLWMRRVVLGLISLILIWTLVRQPGTGAGELMVTYVCQTNDASGGTLALFRITNPGGRRIQFGVGTVQLQGAEGWPPLWMLGEGTSDWVAVEAGSNVVVSVSPPVPSADVAWRIPLIYERDPSSLVGFLDNNLGRSWRKRSSSFAVGPAMVGWPSSPTVQLTAPLPTRPAAQPSTSTTEPHR